MTKATIRFYEVERGCLFSRAVHFLGQLSGYDMTLVHCAIEWDGFVSDFTIDGIGYYSVTDEEEVRQPAVMIELEIDTNVLYERSVLLAYTNLRLSYGALIRKMLKLPARDGDLLCTDYVQLLLGEEPQHYSAVEFLQSLISDSIEDTSEEYSMN